MGNNSVVLSGKSEFKGRNGYARLSQVQYICLPATELEEGDRHFIDLFSKRAGEPPARLVLTPEDLAAFKAWVASLGTPQGAPGRIEVLGWREHGDDDDSTEIAVFAADDLTSAQDLIEAEHDVVFDGNGGKGHAYDISEQSITDGEILTSHNGRKFRVSITEVKA